MQRFEVFDALSRINEGLKDDSEEHQRIIARHDLIQLTRYISNVEEAMDRIENQAKGWEVIPHPWQVLEQVQKEAEEIQSRLSGSDFGRRK